MTSVTEFDLNRTEWEREIDDARYQAYLDKKRAQWPFVGMTTLTLISSNFLQGYFVFIEVALVLGSMCYSLYLFQKARQKLQELNSILTTEDYLNYKNRMAHQQINYLVKQKLQDTKAKHSTDSQKKIL